MSSSPDLRGRSVREREGLHHPIILRDDVCHPLLSLLGVGLWTKPSGEGKHPKVTLNLDHGYDLGLKCRIGWTPVLLLLVPDLPFFRAEVASRDMAEK